MRILHVISQRPDSTGSGFYLQAVMQAAAAAGHDNYLCAAIGQDRPPDLGALPAEKAAFVRFESEAHPGRLIGMSDVMPYPSRTFRQLKAADLKAYLDHFRATLLPLIGSCRPDLIHCHHLWLLSSLVRELAPAQPVIASCHGTDLRQFRQCPHLRSRVLAGCGQLDAVLALSGEQRNEIAAVYGIEPERIIVTGAGYNDAVFRADATPLQAEVPEILYAGKLSRAKGVPFLLQALGGLDRLPFHLHLAGSGAGPELEECRRYAAALGGRVTLHGAVEQKRLAALMRRCHLFILPSLHEGLPLVVLEALACGCLVLATDLPGTREIAANLSGDRLSLIDSPHLIDTDRTILADEQLFIERLRTAVATLLTLPRTPASESTGLDAFTWQAVFRRIETVWLRLAAPLS